MSKSGDSSLHDWFNKSKSSDGKKGWVQLGGKYAGKPCAKQPGQTTKPKCGSSKMKRDLNKDEEEAAFRRKNKKDPNPNRKGKAINVATEETVLEKAGEKDACYKKVKSRYSVWPSAYASGALVKCRKVGAANWGNKSESVELDEKKAQKCWPGYEKKGTKMMFGKRYNNCVKKEEFSDWRGELSYEGKDALKKKPGGIRPRDSYATLQMDRETKADYFKKRGELIKNKQLELDKASMSEAKSPAWQRKEGKSESGGLNKKGVASYRAANPGSKLKTAVTTKPSKLKKGSKAANRRKSFCSRMKGMKKKLTSAKTARDPDSRINKSLRKWNC